MQLRDDIPDLMVSHGDLLVPRHLSLPGARAEALLQHEITHVVTYPTAARSHSRCSPPASPATRPSYRHGLSVRAGFGIVIRVFRCGGVTKDAIYLRGLLQLLDHFAAGGAVEPLLVGKVALDQVPLVEELLRRQVLRPPPLRPRWLDAPAPRPGSSNSAAASVRST